MLTCLFFISLFKYFKFVKLLKKKRGKNKDWWKYMNIDDSDRAIKEIVRNILCFRTNDVELDFNLEFTYLKWKRMFFKYPEVRGRFTLDSGETVSFKAYSRLTKNYYMQYEIKILDGTKFHGMGSISECFKQIKQKI